MSIYVLGPVLRHEFPDMRREDGRIGVSGRVLKLVAAALADSAHQDGTGARPTLQQMALFAQCSRGTARRAVNALLELGFVEVERAATPRTPTWFRVTIQGLRDETSGVAQDDTPGVSSDETSHDATPVQKETPGVRSHATPDVLAYATRSVLTNTSSDLDSRDGRTAVRQRPPRPDEERQRVHELVAGVQQQLAARTTPATHPSGRKTP